MGTKRTSALVSLLAALLSTGAQPARQSVTDTVVTERWRSIQKSSRWRSPTVNERRVFRDGMRELFRLAERGCETTEWEAARRHLSKASFSVDEPSNGIHIVQEHPSTQRGGGIYVIRCGKSDNLIIQAPHSFYDLETGRLAIALFVLGNARAVFLNTIHRYRALPREHISDPVHPADVAHEAGSFFHAATVGAAVGDRQLRFVQLHGFEKRRSRARVIVSSGLASSPPLEFSRKLEKQLPGVRTFGHDSKTLGATTNVQGRMLNRQTPGRFLHIELSLSTRKRLLGSRSQQRALLAALKGAW